MQIIDRKNIEKRILFYWSRMYQKTIKKGEDYDKLRKCIVVLFIDYELNITKNIPEYLTKWNIREKKYPKHILLNDLEFCIIELPKYEKIKEKNNTLNTWLKFIINQGEIDMGKETNKAVKKAKKVLEEISQDARERELAELREKYIMDQKAIEAAGYDKGIEFEKIKIAKELLKNKVDIEIIIKSTGLTKEEILKL